MSIINERRNIYIIYILSAIAVIFLVLYLTNLKHYSSIEQPVKNLLNKYIEIDYEHKSLDYSNIINNPKLIEKLILQREYNQKLFPDFYKPRDIKYTISINRITKKSDNNYFVKFELLVGKGMRKDKEYFAMLQKENDKYYINRIEVSGEDSGDNKKLEKLVKDEKEYNKHLDDSISYFEKKKSNQNGN